MGHSSLSVVDSKVRVYVIRFIICMVRVIIIIIIMCLHLKIYNYTLEEWLQKVDRFRILLRNIVMFRNVIERFGLRFKMRFPILHLIRIFSKSLRMCPLSTIFRDDMAMRILWGSTDSNWKKTEIRVNLLFYNFVFFLTSIRLNRVPVGLLLVSHTQTT